VEPCGVDHFASKGVIVFIENTNVINVSKNVKGAISHYRFHFRCKLKKSALPPVVGIVEEYDNRTLVSVPICAVWQLDIKHVTLFVIASRILPECQMPNNGGDKLFFLV
jgi:hypothetical protein